MPQANDWWSRQFVEETKEIARLYDLFDTTRELATFDRAEQLCKDLNEGYGVSLDLLDFVKLGRSLLGKHDLPNSQEHSYGRYFT
jgi:hypothetical protein